VSQHQVSVEGQKQTPKSVGSTYLESNQELDTGNGNAEVLLTHSPTAGSAGFRALPRTMAMNRGGMPMGRMGGGFRGGGVARGGFGGRR
jgi:hypothetical protein